MAATVFNVYLATMWKGNPKNLKLVLLSHRTNLSSIISVFIDSLYRGKGENDNETAKARPLRFTFVFSFVTHVTIGLTTVF
jgi:hypothetical protein